MPYSIRKVPNKNCYSVKNRKSGIYRSKCTSKNKAKKQIRLLSALEFNPKFRFSVRSNTRKRL